jgi:hypothetical protein
LFQPWFFVSCVTSSIDYIAFTDANQNIDFLAG